MTILSYASQSFEKGIGFVYKWTNKTNGMMYIGSHKGNSQRYLGSGVAFRAAVNKYGIENFQREILYKGPNFLSVEVEILVSIGARQSSNFYNRVNKASEGTLGMKSSTETRAKNGAPHKGKPKSAEQRAKMSASGRGKVRSTEHVTNHRASLTGYKHTEESKSKMSSSSLGKSKTDLHRANISAGLKGKPNRGSHIRWHVTRDIFSSACSYCTSPEI